MVARFLFYGVGFFAYQLFNPLVEEVAMIHWSREATIVKQIEQRYHAGPVQTRWHVKVRTTHDGEFNHSMVTASTRHGAVDWALRHNYNID